MCGIHLVQGSGSALAQLAEQSQHRGPDHTATQQWQVGAHTLNMAANRLMISDRNPASHQPLAGPEGSWLVYNGELYNAQELRNELLAVDGVSFRTASDTEVLLHALYHWGPAVLPRLNGMFAFAFWHGQRQCLWVARDRSGIKPLYFTPTTTGRAYSSEAKALVAASLASPDLQPSEIPHLLAYRHVQSSALVQVQPLPPGALHTWSLAGGWEETRWLKQSPTPPASGELQERLTDALLRQMEAHVRVGLFLSGGVDSTLLLALLHAEGIPRMPAFTVGHRPEDRHHGTRDAYYAAQAAQQYGTTLEVLTVTPQHLERFPEYIAAMDQPLGDSGGFLTWLLAEKAKESGMGVVLSGAGADELFAGYHRHAAFARYLRHQKRWLSLAPGLRRLSGLYPRAKGVPGRARMQLLYKFAHRLHPNPARTFRQFQGLSLPPDHQTFWDSQALEDAPEDWLDWALREEQQTYLVQDVLSLSDTFTLAHGLELRVPYLDTELMAYANQLSAREHLAQGPKSLLKTLLNSLDGKAYTQRRKEGFGLPLGHWIRTGEADTWLQILHRSDLALWEHVDPAGPRTWLRAHQRGQADYAQELWNVITLATWWEGHKKTAGGYPAVRH